jgi:uncharacterized protein YjiS (DUF1127 family)
MNTFITAALRRMHDRWSRRRSAHRTAEALGHLDTQALRDIGLTRGEIFSVAAETAGYADATRIGRGR